MVFMLAIHSRASLVVFAFTNSNTGMLDTNIYRLQPLKNVQNADGTYNMQGPPVQYQNPTGMATNWLVANTYMVTNPATGFWDLIRPPDASSNLVYAGNISSHQNANPFWTLVYNPSIAPGANITFTTNGTQITIASTGGGGGGTPALAGTNVYIATVNGSNQFNVPTTAFDAPGAAQAATNGLANGAFTPTNSFDGAGQGAASALAATNHLGSAAFYPTNTFDLAGLALAIGLNVTNAIASTNKTTLTTVTNLAANATNYVNVSTNGFVTASITNQAVQAVAALQARVVTNNQLGIVNLATNSTLTTSNLSVIGDLTNQNNLWVGQQDLTSGDGSATVITTNGIINIDWNQGVQAIASSCYDSIIINTSNPFITNSSIDNIINDSDSIFASAASGNYILNSPELTLVSSSWSLLLNDSGASLTNCNHDIILTDGVHTFSGIGINNSIIAPNYYVGPNGSGYNGNGFGLTNLPTSINPTNSNNGVLINCSQPYQWFVTNASFAMSGYGSRAVGNYGTPVLTVSNSSASVIYVTIPTGTFYPTNSSLCTNIVTLPGGSVTVFSFMVTDWQTNCMDGGLWP